MADFKWVFFMQTQKSEASSRQVRCPQCGKQSLFSVDNSYRPFCSERCKLIDLGQWADEKYTVPITPAEDLSDDENDASNDVSPELDEEIG